MKVSWFSVYGKPNWISLDVICFWLQPWGVSRLWRPLMPGWWWMATTPKFNAILLMKHGISPAEVLPGLAPLATAQILYTQVRSWEKKATMEYSLIIPDYRSEHCIVLWHYSKWSKLRHAGIIHPDHWFIMVHSLSAQHPSSCLPSYVLSSVISQSAFHHKCRSHLSAWFQRVAMIGKWTSFVCLISLLVSRLRVHSDGIQHGRCQSRPLIRMPFRNWLCVLGDGWAMAVNSHSGALMGRTIA